MYVRVWGPRPGCDVWTVAFLCCYGIGNTYAEAYAALKEDLLYA